MKKGRISKLEINFIIQNKNLPPEKIAQELDRSVDAVNQVLESQKQTTKVGKEIQDLIRKEGKMQKGARVMTPTTSELTEVYRKKGKQNPSFIYRPYGNENDN